MVIYKSTFPPVALPDIDLYTLHFLPNKFNSAFPHDQPIVIDGPTGKSLTYNQVKDLAGRLATGWTENAGLKKGDVVASFAPNQYDHIVLYLSLLGAKCTISPGNPNYTEAEFLHQVSTSGAKAVVTVPELLPVLLKVCTKTGIPTSRIFLFGDKASGDIRPFYTLLAGTPVSMPIKDIDPKNDVAYICYSSGTTGLPKGVMLTHQNFVSQTLCSLAMDPNNLDPNVPVQQGAIAVGILPFYHIYGMTSLVFNNFYKAIPIVVMGKYSLKLFCELVQKYKINIAALVPPIVVQLTKNPIVKNYDMSSLQLIACGAAPLGKEHVDGLAHTTPALVRQGYGMTETTSGCIAQLLETAVPGSIGVVCPNNEVKIVDEKGNELGDDQEGEILVRGTNIMKGYLNNPKANAEIFTSDGWLRTGDTGKYDSATKQFFIVDRIKELIKCKGFQVAPAELEGLILKIPEVNDVCVIGVYNTAEATEYPRAYVVLQDGVKADDAIAQKIIDSVAAQVASYKRLQGGVRFVDQIPKLATGKILRRTIREWAKQEEAANTGKAKL